MNLTKLLAAACAVTALGFPVWAQEAGGDATAPVGDMQDADAAADTMMTTIRAREVPTSRGPSEVIARLQEPGYTNLDEFDVEWGEHEVEAVAPNGNEGEILQIDKRF